VYTCRSIIAAHGDDWKSSLRLGHGRTINRWGKRLPIIKRILWMVRSCFVAAVRGQPSTP
jgi:hypothetical protein